MVAGRPRSTTAKLMANGTTLGLSDLLKQRQNSCIKQWFSWQTRSLQSRPPPWHESSQAASWFGVYDGVVMLDGGWVGHLRPSLPSAHSGGLLRCWERRRMTRRRVEVNRRTAAWGHVILPNKGGWPTVHLVRRCRPSWGWSFLTWLKWWVPEGFTGVVHRKAPCCSIF
jgi:hypothetical protein